MQLKPTHLAVKFLFGLVLMSFIGSFHLAQAAKQTGAGNCSGIFVLISSLIGVILFTRWTIKTEFGTKAFPISIHRPNLLPFQVVFTVIFGWLAVTVLSSYVIRTTTGAMANWQQDFATYLALVVVEIIITIFILASAGRFFYSGLSGLGLRGNRIGADIAAAAAMLITAWPLVIIALYFVITVGKWIVGPGFQMDQNEGLVVIIENNQLSLRILTIFFAVILTPVFEELLFRGLLQSYFRNIDMGPWKSILASSVIFSILHPLMHFPALLILSIFMGYAYEKSGSLYRSIFLHMFFNGAMITISLSNL